MFNSKNVRNSFLLFDSDNKSKNINKNDHKATSKHKETKTVTDSKKKPDVTNQIKLEPPIRSSKRVDKKDKLPLARSPLINFKDDFEHTRNKTELSFNSSTNVNNISHSDKNIPVSQKGSSGKTLGKEINTKEPGIALHERLQNTRQRRPPPPNINMESIRRSVDKKRIENKCPEVLQDFTIDTSGIKEIDEPISSQTYILNADTEDISKIDTSASSHNDLRSVDTSIIENEQTFKKEHTRKRSEAESLVDDLENFIQEFKEKSTSIEDILGDNDVDDERRSLNDSRSSESSLLYITPLDVESTHNNPNFTTDDHSFPKKKDFSRQTLTIANLSSHDVQEINDLKNDSSNSDGDSSNSESDLSSSNFSFSRSIKHAPLNGPLKYDLDEPLPVLNDINLLQPVRKQTNPFIDFDNVTKSSATVGSDYDKISDRNIIPDNRDNVSPDTQATESTVQKNPINSADLINEILNSDASHSSPDTSSISHVHNDSIVHSTSKQPSLQNGMMDNLINEVKNDYDDNQSSDDSDDSDSSDKSSSASSLSDEMIIRNEAPRRKFRVVNEAHPTFFFPTDEQSINRNSGSYTDENTISDTEVSSINYLDHRDRSLVSDNIDDIILDNKNEDSIIDGTTVLSPKFTNNTEGNNQSIDETISLDDSKTSMSTFSENNLSQNTFEVSSRSNERSTKLVSGYVEELRLRYYKTSNFLEAPPNLPMVLKQKNNLIQPKNIKVKIRTNTKQIGIKHGRVKQKLLASETTNDKGNTESKSVANVDHSKELHNFFNKEDAENSEPNTAGIDEDSRYLNDIPGDDAYDSDDILAPLREKKDSHIVSRSDTVVSYYTKSQNRLKNKDFLEGAPELPSHIIKGPKEAVAGHNEQDSKRVMRSGSINTINSQYITKKISGSLGLHIANPDSDTD